MNLEKFKKKVNKPLRKANLLFLMKDDKVLLGLKKRGFGKNRFNGVGGKPIAKETIEQCAIREAEEEIGVVIKSLEKRAVLDFYFPGVPLKEDWNQQVIVFVSKEWKGSPKETEEIAPKWFKINELPFNKMWSDDPLWLPHVLVGKSVRAEFAFGENDKTQEYKIKIR